ncbi:serine/threonine-protein kinase [bacterium]|nr:serine/threonine-protein kinase [bacterium]MDB4664380.1 serine/threonine-protein kinase [bacterium]
MSESPRTNDPLDEAFADYLRMSDAGEIASREDFLKLFPDLADDLKELIEAADLFGEVTLGGQPAGSSSGFNVGTLAHNAETIATSALASDSSGDPDITLPIANRGANAQGPCLPYDLGDYVLLEEIGRGGMGVVYLAKQHELDRQVAIKMIRSGILADEGEVRRFYTEAQAAARLRHRGIVGVHQFGRRAGHHFFSMEFIPGTDLQKKINSGLLEPKEAARYVRDVARAIQHAHHKGVLHRDLKPANVLIDEHDQIHVTDFGLAKHMDSDSSVTGSGAAIGTPHYMAPEQAGGHSDRVCTQSDVYALGAILFACLTGRPPILADTVVQTLMQVVHQPAPPVRSLRSDVPLDLETIVAKCLEKSPGKRYASAEKLANELDAFIEGRHIEARPRSQVLKAWHWFEGVPVVGALTGRRVLHSSSTHRRFQAAMLLGLLLTPLLAVSLHIGIQHWPDAMPKSVSIAGGVEGGRYNIIAKLLADQIKQSQPEVSPDIQATLGSEENSRLLLNDEVDLALIQAVSIPAEEKLAHVAPLYYEPIYALVRKDSGIKTIQQFNDLPVLLGPVGTGSRACVELMIKTLPNAFGKMKILSGKWDQLLSENAPQAAILCLGQESPFLDKLRKDGRWRLLEINPDKVVHAFDRFPLEDDITNTSAPTTIQTLATTAILMAKQDTSDALITAVLDAWYELDHPKNRISMKEASQWTELRLHPAAEQYYRDHSDHPDVQK